MVNLILISMTVCRSFKILFLLLILGRGNVDFPLLSTCLQRTGCRFSVLLDSLCMKSQRSCALHHPTEETGLSFQLWPWSLLGSASCRDSVAAALLMGMDIWVGEREGKREGRGEGRGRDPTSGEVIQPQFWILYTVHLCLLSGLFMWGFACVPFSTVWWSSRNK